MTTKPNSPAGPLAACTAVLLACVVPAATAIGPDRLSAEGPVQRHHVPYRPGELIVKYRPGKQAGSASMQALKAAHGLRSGGTLFGGRYERLRLPSVLDVPGAVAMLSGDPAIEYAEPNFLRRRHAVTPNDALFSRQWGLLNTGQANFVDGGPAGTPGADINAPNAWDLDGNGVPDRTGRGLVTIAVIDDAVDVDHPDLAANMVPGFDFVDGDSNPRPTSNDESHGTAVAGAAAAVGGNGIGIAGAAWNERIMPLRFGFDVATQIAAFDFARLNGARIINASYGGPGYSQAEVDAIAALDRAGILFIASSGNQDSNLDFSGATYPANYRLPNVMAVAATNRQDGIASFSTYGPVTVPLAAPGLQIVTTVPGGGYTSTTGVNGTSFSAPYVAGIAALIRDYIPSASVSEVKARLINASEPGLDAGNPASLRTAGGRLNAATALSLSPGPAIVIRPQAISSYALTFSSGTVNVPVQEAVVVEDGGNGRLDPGESAELRVMLENLWLTATNVRVRLTATGGATTGSEVAIGTLEEGATATVRLPVSVSPTLTGYRQLAFTLAITADGGYSATRRFLLDVGRLDAGVTVSQRFQSGLYDEFHTWVIDVPSNGSRLSVQSGGSNDIDVFVRYGEPAQYSIDLDADVALSEGDSEPFYFVNVPDAQRGDQSQGADETVIIPNTRAGSYYITVVNFDRTPNALYTLRASLTGGSLPGPDPGVPGGGSGGGAGAPWLLGLLAIARLRMRRQPPPARADRSPRRGLHEAPKAC